MVFQGYHMAGALSPPAISAYWYRYALILATGAAAHGARGHTIGMGGVPPLPAWPAHAEYRISGFGLAPRLPPRLASPSGYALIWPFPTPPFLQPENADTIHLITRYDYGLGGSDTHFIADGDGTQPLSPCPLSPPRREGGALSTGFFEYKKPVEKNQEKA